MRSQRLRAWLVVMSAVRAAARKLDRSELHNQVQLRMVHGREQIGSHDTPKSLVLMEVLGSVCVLFIIL